MCPQIKKQPLSRSIQQISKKAAPRFELGMEDLQSTALPLGYTAVVYSALKLRRGNSCLYGRTYNYLTAPYPGIEIRSELVWALPCPMQLATLWLCL